MAERECVMERKKIIIFVCALVLFVFYSTAFSQSASWYTCKVNEVGPRTSMVIIKLTDTGGKFLNKWFMISNNLNPSLATALTAISTGANLRIGTYLTGSPYPEIVSFYLIAP